jgi:hypothetical protein
LTAEITDGKPFVIMTCRSNLKPLCEAEVILADGTFKYCPSSFTQIYTIHGCFNGHYVPLVHALLAEKTQTCYQHLIDILLRQLLSMGLEWKPKFIKTDFEVSETINFTFCIDELFETKTISLKYISMKHVFSKLPNLARFMVVGCCH